MSTDPDDDLTIPPFLRRAPAPPAPEKPQERDPAEEIKDGSPKSEAAE